MGYLPDPSNVTGLNFENPLHGPTFDTNAECSLDLQMSPNDNLFDLGLSMEPPQRPQDDFNQRAIAKGDRQRLSLESSEPTDTLTALSRLNEDIARQISNIDSYFGGHVNAAQRCLDELHDIEGNLVTKMLQSTSRFVTILEHLDSLSLPPNKSVDRPVPHLPSASDCGVPNSDSEQWETLPPATPLPVHLPYTELRPLSTPVVLMLLSSYLLLLELYNALFSRAHDTLSKLEDSCAYFQEIPEIRVAGLSSMKGHLYAKIIIQIIKHHFDRLECLLGLPVEFGLSEQTPRSSGLLGTVALSHLLHVTMTQMTGSPGTSGRLTLQSFRDNLNALQAMLPG